MRVFQTQVRVAFRNYSLSQSYLDSRRLHRRPDSRTGPAPLAFHKLQSWPTRCVSYLSPIHPRFCPRRRAEASRGSHQSARRLTRAPAGHVVPRLHPSQCVAASRRRGPRVPQDGGGRVAEPAAIPRRLALLETRAPGTKARAPASSHLWPFSRLCCAFLQSFLVIMFIGMVAFLLLSRFVYHDPEFQNPFIIIFLVILLLMVVAHGFLSTRDM